MSWTRRDAAATFQRMVEERHREQGRVVARLREARGWNQETLAHEAKLSVKTISRMENGHHEGRGSTVTAVADALGVPVETLLALRPAGITDEPTQMDRIEQKLDLILSRLGLLAPEPQPEEEHSIEQVLEALERNADKRSGSTAKGRRAPRAEGH